MMKLLEETSTFAIAVALLIGSCASRSNALFKPKAKFEVLEPRGLVISIPDEPGLRYFAFHGNVNKKIGRTDNGEISGVVYQPKNGRWTIQDPRITVREQDVIHYWVGLQHDDSPYTIPGLSWRQESTTGDGGGCIPSITLVRNGVGTCKGQLIFEEDFDTLNSSVWTREIKIPSHPDYEFCVYHNHEESLIIKNGTLRVVPSLPETAVDAMQLAQCTSYLPDECSRRAVSFHILPPVISARLSTSLGFSFQYGRIEIRAKFPEGDWLYPEMWLEPRSSRYGENYRGGRIRLGMARGNPQLLGNGGSRKEVGGQLLEFGVRMGSGTTDVWQETVESRSSNGTWASDFHEYSTTWTDQGFTFQVDGVEVGGLNPGTTGWSRGNHTGPWTTGSTMAPFDQEFFIKLGVGAGGVREFPDGTTSRLYGKPWKNTGAKATLEFWNAKEQWLPSWPGNLGKTALEVDYVRVWAI